MIWVGDKGNQEKTFLRPFFMKKKLEGPSANMAYTKSEKKIRKKIEGPSPGKKSFTIFPLPPCHIINGRPLMCKGQHQHFTSKCLKMGQAAPAPPYYGKVELCAQLMLFLTFIYSCCTRIIFNIYK